MKNRRYEIRLSGSGGQGLVLAGIILAEAASVYQHKRTVQTQSYGPESRGGASKSEVVLSNAEIDFPKVTEPDFLLAMTQEACDKYIHNVKHGGAVVLDSSTVHDCPSNGYKVFSLPLTEMSRKTTGRAISANIVALGATAAVTHAVSQKALEKAVRARVPAGTEKMNMAALRAGYEMGRAAVSDLRVHGNSIPIIPPVVPGNGRKRHGHA